MDEETLLKKLRWRCRRGMRELDQLFERYLDREWSAAPTEEREVFLFLLDCEAVSYTHLTLPTKA